MSMAPQKELELLLRTWRAEAVQRASARTGRVNPDAEQLRILLDSVAYRLGRTLVDGLRSPRDMLRLPAQLYRIAERWRASRRMHAPKPIPAQANSTAPPQVGSHGQVQAWRSTGPAERTGAPDDLRNVRIALVADRFTTECIAPDSPVVSIHPATWREQIESFTPHILFVESAWQGLQGEWQARVAATDTVLRELVDECRRRGIPAVFWNKEDPLHFEEFIRTAGLFDIVCTTDFDSIARYKRELGHDQVHLLPFFLQPSLHNPVSSKSGERRHASFFAGAWYGNLSQRCMDFCDLADALALAGDFHIYDRNAGTDSAARRYPQRYQECQRGAVEYAATPALYRSYTIGLTINTVKDSPTMFARRALELMGSGTSVYSNYCQAMVRIFGDLAVVSDDGERVLREAYEELRNPDAPAYRMRRMRALRKVLREHTWLERLQWLVRLVHGRELEMPGRAVVVLAHVTGQGQADALKTMLAAQKIAATCHAWAADDISLPDGVRRLTAVELEGSLQAVAGDRHVAVWNLEDRYGEDYLSDLALSLGFRVADVIGKACPVDDAADVDGEYALVDRIPLERSLFPSFRWSGSVKELLQEPRGSSIAAEKILRIDGSSYRKHGTDAMSDQDVDRQLDEGLSMAAIREVAGTVRPSPAYPAESISGSALADWFPQSALPFGVSMVPRRHRLEIVSKLGADGSAAISSRPFALGRASGHEGTPVYCLDAPGHAGMSFHLRSTDGAGRVMASIPLPPNSNRRLPRQGAGTGHLLVEITGSGVAYVDALWHRERPVEAPMLCGAGRLLVVTNGYPGEGSLYKNAFVHGRVLRYRALGANVDVVWLSTTEPPRTYEHEGVPVIVCSPAALKAGLAHTRYDAIAAHFLDEDMWEAIEDAAGASRTVIWLHGAEIQSWERRLCNHATAGERAAARAASEQRTAFWREFLGRMSEHVHLVFVSRQFAEETLMDLGMPIPEDRWSVIHNPIDTDLFSYQPKTADQRYRIVSVRPHDYRIYANDMVAEAIRILAAEPFFEQLHFTLVGDGALFEENFRGLDAFPNVVMQRRFFTRQELASLYHGNGIMLVPTRGDTHGVSRDEAMASGVVPVTTDAGAVTEFVDASSAVVGAVDDAAALAAGVKALILDKERFLAMSQAAAMRVRRQSDAALIVGQELSVLAQKGRI